MAPALRGDTEKKKPEEKKSDAKEKDEKEAEEKKGQAPFHYTDNTQVMLKCFQPYG